MLPVMTAKVIVKRRPRSDGSGGISVPSVAVGSGDSGEPYVWIVDPDTLVVTRRTVTLGELSGSEVEVRGGLTEGDVIAASGVHHLREGMTVRRYEP